MINLIQTVEPNNVGRDFIVGDIHGCWFRLKQAINAVEFNPERDRLFHVGDLIDRGTDHDLMDEFIGKPWFIGVMGNHDASLHAYKGHDTYGLRTFCIPYHFHEWFEALSKEEQTFLLQETYNLPLAIELKRPNGLPIIIAHGDLPEDTWADAKTKLEAIQNKPDNQLRRADYHYLAELMWSRHSANKANLYNGSGIFDPVYDAHIIEQAHEQLKVPDVQCVISGHTPFDTPNQIGNRLFIDTGVVYCETQTKPFTLVQINDELGKIPE